MKEYSLAMAPHFYPDEATLDEVLFITGEALCERDLWAILLAASIATLNFIEKDALSLSFDEPLPILHPDTLLLNINGTMNFIRKEPENAKEPRPPPLIDYHVQNFVSPESEVRSFTSFNSNQLKSNVEKMIIYSLGMCVLLAAQYPNHFFSESLVPAEIRLLLSKMKNGAGTGISAVEIKKICLQHIDTWSCASRITALSKTILVSPEELLQSNLILPDPKNSINLLNERKSVNEKCISSDIIESLSSGEIEGNFRVSSSHSSLTLPLNPQKVIANEWNSQHLFSSQPNHIKPIEHLIPVALSRREIDRIAVRRPTPELSSKSDSDLRKYQRRHSSGSCATGLLNMVNSSSERSLMFGSYSLDGPLNMDSAHPLQRFKSDGVLSHSGPSISSLTLYNPVQHGGIHFPQLGPEFVRVPSDPATAFVDIMPLRLGPLPKNHRLISVVLPNGQVIHSQVQITDKGKELFEQIARHIGLVETLYFGLVVIEGEEDLFMDLDEKLMKYSPSGWKEKGGKRKKEELEFIVYFQVKFFVENPLLLKHKLTKHYYYLQLRKSIAGGHIHVADDLLYKLIGYALQAEFGPFVAEFMGCQYFQLKHYLPPNVLNHVNHNVLMDKLSFIHQTIGEKSPEDAELEFLKLISQIDEYGVLFYEVSRSKNNDLDTVLLGISIKGLIIKECKRNRRILMYEEGWDSMKRFYFKKKQFKIKSKNSEEKLTFYTGHYRRSKYLFNLCTSFHRFQIYNQSLSKATLKMKTKDEKSSNTNDYSSISKTNQKTSLDINFVEDETMEEYSERCVDVLDYEPKASIYSENKGCPKLQSNENLSKLERLASYPKRCDKDAIVHSSNSNGEEFIHSDSPLSETTPVPSQPLKRFRDSEHLNVADVSVESLNMSMVSRDSFFSPGIADDVSDHSFVPNAESSNISSFNFKGGIDQLNEIVNTEEDSLEEAVPLFDSPENVANQSEWYSSEEDTAGCQSISSIENSEHLEIDIEKKDGSFGFSIMGGADSDNPLGGVFVKSLLRNGAASLSGQIKVGDRVVSVGGLSLENASHSKAVEILRQSSEKTVIVVSRSNSDYESNLLARVQHLKAMNSMEFIFGDIIEKEEDGLGLCLVGGRNSDLIYKDQIMIRKISPGLPIARCGKFQAGDVLLAVNDQIMEGMTNAEALLTIRNAPKRVSIIAKRPNPNDIPPELYMTSRPVSPEEILKELTK